MNESTTNDAISFDFNTPAAERHRHRRHLKDVATRYLMVFGGVSVIIAIVLIAFYLFYVVVPMFIPPKIKQEAIYSIPGDASEASLMYAMEEQHEIGLRLTDAGKTLFFNTEDGSENTEFTLPASDVATTSKHAADPSTRIITLGKADGSAVMFQHDYKVTYPDDKRLITPSLYYPLGEEAVQIDAEGSPLTLISAQASEDGTSIIALTESNKLLLVSYEKEENMLSDEVEIIETRSEIDVNGSDVTHLEMDIEQRELFFADTAGHIYFYDISNKTQPKLVDKVTATTNGNKITSISFLVGGISILVGMSDGEISQWFPVRDENNQYTLQKIRSFNTSNGAAVTWIEPEYFRKGFLTLDENQQFGIYHTTAHRKVLEKRLDTDLTHLGIAPRANAALIEQSDGQVSFWHIHNEHPEISWNSLFGDVWYESRDKGEYIWQSSSADSDFEPKFSLTPLVFGTFKAAFYALLFAIPMAIMGAIYTAYFMSPKIRGVVKPTIEIMEALPTVILGFLAGLWLAPFVETNMPGVFMLMIFLPSSVLIAALAWEKFPKHIRNKVDDGWEAALLVPVLIVAAILALSLSQPVELWLFDGNMTLWINNELGISYDQRNSLVVGIAMGLAVIPTIFSISEDAIFSVPKHLTTGSLALGATYWQTMVRVVLLTASPGIFSAIMIGLGRAVGETMIVVMATGNTAIMDMNIFQGFRALSANIAVEMPESEVGSTHYRILFLAGFVLFGVTFFFNTIAEIVRQRLRTKYSSL